MNIYFNFNGFLNIVTGLLIATLGWAKSKKNVVYPFVL